MHADRRIPVALLAVLYAFSGALCLIAAVWPPHPRSPVALLLAIGIIGLGGAAVFWVLGARTRWAAMHGAIALAGVLVALLAWRSATAVGIVGLGPTLVAIGLYAAYFFPLTAARLHVLALVTVATAGAIAAAPGHFTVPWVVLVLATLGLTEAQGRLARSLRTAATTDPLTGVANRRAWEAEASRCLARAARTGEPMTVAILDLDGFKEVNDRDGHVAGDRLLREVATQWCSRLRASDLLGRHGGDEFVLCLPGTDAAGAVEVLQRLEGGLPIGWSVGTATARAGDSLADLLQRADDQLYRGKRSRRGAAES